MAIPTVLLFQAKVRMRPGALYACAVMVVFGFITNRLNVGITGLEAGSGTHYIPKWSEVAVTLSIVAAGFAIFHFVAQNFPVFEAAAHEPAHAALEETEEDPVAVVMQPPNKIRLGLAAKLAICVIASTAAFFALFGYINLRMERSHSEELIKQSAYRVADVILRSTHYEMLHNDRDALHNIIRELGSENGIRRIRLFNKEGRITLSTRSRRNQYGGG